MFSSFIYFQKLSEVLKEDNIDRTMIEFGDILFSLVNVARFANFHPETALNLSTAKFENRFKCMEKTLKENNLQLTNLSDRKKNDFWNKAKQKIN